ncbi:hypothetical protein Vadar_000813 [Vaccinium darrowii]|uniref:Uncharacterized protein n=1 Tax=Vaccinium darrowii TaxID=229202 RepID=A0ACB7X6M2_9ERIC|nr:hypothetical protein Vadar_000813 [Vaccinium darrowii]
MRPENGFPGPLPFLRQVWEGEGVIKYGRKLIGATDPQKSEPRTIKGDLAVVGRFCFESVQPLVISILTLSERSFIYRGWLREIKVCKVGVETVVWVANRGDPINDTSGSLSFDSTGNLVINGPEQTNPVWSTNVSNPTLAKSSSAQLLDTGNLELLDSNGVVVWQSFDYPTDTLLPYLRFGVDRKTGLNRFMTAWKSRDDPGLGEYSFKMDLNGSPQLFLYKGSVVLWRAGSWIGRGWSGVPEMTPNFIFSLNYVENQDEVTLSYSIRNASIFSKMVLNESGKLERLTWHDNEHRWDRFYSAPKDQCDTYNYCGSNGNCDPSNAGMGLFDCACLPGFEPKSASDWYLRDGSGGCVRKRGGHVCGNGEGFVKVARAKVPNTWTARVNKSILALKECELECLRNCTCNGYASADVFHGDGSGGCVMWFGALIDTRVFPSGGQDFYVRVDAVELETREEQNLLFSPYNTTSLEASSMGKHFDGSGTNAELPYFDLSIIVSATDNFSLANKLGEGGFGTVYKGRLHNGQEIAIKSAADYTASTSGDPSPYHQEQKFGFQGSDGRAVMACLLSTTKCSFWH